MCMSVTMDDVEVKILYDLQIQALSILLANKQCHSILKKHHVVLCTFMLLSSVMRYAYHALSLKVKVKKESETGCMYVKLCRLV